MFVSVAPDMFAPVTTVFEISVSVKLASLKFTPGPIMYPPLTELWISRYVVGENTVGRMGDSGVPVPGARTCSRPDFVFVKFTFVNCMPSTYTADMSVFVKLAPLKSTLGPIM